MPKRTDIKKILLIGSGPIIISQACEFDYSGTQACKALREEGYEVVLINSNPATIMTDPEMADRTYVEPITPEAVTKIIARERPDALLPTLGGQTGLNTAVALAESGVLEKYGVEMIGASLDVIHKAEDREKFRHAIEKIGLRMPKSGFARSIPEVMKIAGEIGFPIIVRASFTLGGTGSGVAYNREELIEIAQSGLDASMIQEVMIEESVLGWKEYELEVMRDKADNVVIICSIENFDAMGVHTGESITVAPAQTLTDREYQHMRDAAIAIMREIGVETGGSNVQFAIHPATGEMIVVEMNPRVSRSSALASKATGFPIAKIAAKLAVGYTLDEIPNDITRETMASFEPTIDYCVVKIPRWTFEKFPETEDLLTTSMKSVGETMAIGRTFKEALQKAIRSLEIGRFSLVYPLPADITDNKALLKSKLIVPNSLRLFYIAAALQKGVTVSEIQQLTKIDPWFLHQIAEIVEAEEELKNSAPSVELLKAAKQMGFSDRALAYVWEKTETEIRSWREKEKIIPVYKLVDTCAAEFAAYTPYYYSTYETENETRPSVKKKVAIIGGGPNRIGQGIEFDYCCVHASFALREEGVESIMINSNPETVSTDYDTSDKLFFEPVTLEDVLHILQTEKPQGVIVQFGGQTPLNMAKGLEAAGVPIIGTSPDAIDRAENRDRFQEIVRKLNLNQPDNDTARTVDEALVAASRIGYPVLVRPSYVLGGRSMEIVYDPETLTSFMGKAMLVSPDHPILIDKFLEDAIEVDVDAISDGANTVVAGIMEHIEEAGIHSGDSACILPPQTIPAGLLELIEKQTIMLAAELKVVGLMNIQYAIQDGTLYVLEVNPRASRTVPFVSKAIGVPLAKLATKVMLGKTLPQLGFTKTIKPKYICVKEAVFPFNRFPNVDALLGPEMKSTGEVMGIDHSFGLAFAKSQMAAGFKMPRQGTVFISAHDYHKDKIVPIARTFQEIGFKILATRGTAEHLEKHGIKAQLVLKVSEGRPNIVDRIKNGDISMVINTSLGRKSTRDAYSIRRGALTYNIIYTTTIAGARALCEATQAIINEDWQVSSLQEYHHSNESGRPREECGIFAIYGHEDASRLTFFGLFALQHRGQESAGIVSSDGCQVWDHKGMGLVSGVFKEPTLQKLPGKLAIGHVRYSTTGSSVLSNAQPFLVHFADEYYALAHNGNIINARQLRQELENSGSIFQSTMDSEIIIHLMAPHLKDGLEKALVVALSRVEGAYSIIMLTRNKIIAARDPRGFRPLALGKINGSWVVASETCAFDLVAAKYIRDVNPGEIIIIDEAGCKSLQPFPVVKPCHCIFELIYFARPDSQIFGQNVYLCRKRLGHELAREYIPNVDIVMPFPDSGNYAALGYAEESGITFEMGMIRNHYVGRTFIQPTQAMRDFGVRVKLNPVRPLLKGKKVLIVEDSIIRGTTSRNRVENLRGIGVKEIHMAISCPPTTHPCPYGIDFSSKGELIAAKKGNEKAIADFIGLDSLHYLTVEGMVRATGMNEDCFCLACYTGNYPLAPPEAIDKFCLEQP